MAARLIGRAIGVWPPLPPSVYLRRSLPILPYPLGLSTCQLYSRARHGLAEGVRGLGIGAGDIVLMPAWHHGSEVEAVIGTGAACRFYDTGIGLMPEEDELDALVDPGVRALYLIHFLGHGQDAQRWRRWCDQRGLLLIEDAAQAWLSWHGGFPAGSHGDLAVWCLYKSYGLPDGAAVRGPAPLGGCDAAAGMATTLRRHAAWVAQHAAPPQRSTEPPYDAARDFATGEPAAASRVTRWLLPRIAEPGVAEAARRRNYQRLLDAVPHLVPHPFDALAVGSVPFVFPIAVQNKADIIRRFRSHGVRPVDLWSVPHPALPVDEHPHAAWYRRHLVALPVHQGLGDRRAGQLADVCHRLLTAEESPDRPGLGPPDGHAGDETTSPGPRRDRR